MLLFEKILLFFSELLEDGVLTKQSVSALGAVKAKVSVSWLPLQFTWSDFCAQTLQRTDFCRSFFYWEQIISPFWETR